MIRGMRFTLADKAYYLAEYLKELQEMDALPPRTLCEKYKHVRAGEMGLEVQPSVVLVWADDVTAALRKPKSRRNKL